MSYFPPPPKGYENRFRYVRPGPLDTTQVGCAKCKEEWLISSGEYLDSPSAECPNKLKHK